MSERRIPLKPRAAATLAQSFAQISIAQNAYGAQLAYALADADIDVNAVADAKVDGGELVVLFKAAPAEAA